MPKTPLDKIKEDKPNYIEKARQFAIDVLSKMPPLLLDSIDTDFSRSLLERGYMEGVAEMAKYFNDKLL